MSYYADTDFDPDAEPAVDEAQLDLEADRFAYLASFDADRPTLVEAGPFIWEDRPRGGATLHVRRTVCQNRLVFGEVA